MKLVIDELIAELKALHQVVTVTKSVPVFDEFDSPYQTYSECSECEQRWPCRTITLAENYE